MLCAQLHAQAEYRGPEAIAESLRSIARAHPENVQVERIATSRDGREVLALALAAPGPRPAAERPGLLVTAGLDAPLLHTTDAALGALEDVLRREEEPAVRAVLESRVIYWIPLANPDGRARSLSRPRQEVRESSRPADDDRDLRTDEDGPEDLDGDGEILSLRVPDPDGPFVVDADDDRLLRPVEPTDRSRARFRVISEGIDNDGDGQLNEDPAGGVDLARSFPHEHEPRASGSGPYPLSEPEARALADFVLAHPNLQAVVHYGAFDQLATPPAGRDGPPSLRGEHRLAQEDAERYRRVGELYQRLTGLKAKGASTTPRGAWHETVYFDLGLPCFAASLWSTEPPVEGNEPVERRWIAWNDRTLGGSGFVRWRPLEHPQLGSVHVGGWRPFVRSVPPPESAAKLGGPQAAFLLELTSQFARLELETLRVADLGGGVFEIKARITNRGEWPSAFVQGAFTRRRTPLNVEVRGDGIKVLGGDARRAQDVLRTGESFEHQWLVLGARGAPVRVEVRLRGFALAEKSGLLETGGTL